jgi:hypothetical protein
MARDYQPQSDASISQARNILSLPLPPLPPPLVSGS